MSSGHVLRKHPRVYLGRLHAFVAHQVLQRLQRYPGVEHVHGIAVAEGMRRHWQGERDSVTCSGVDGLVQLGTHRPVGDGPESDLFGPPGFRVPPL